MIKLYTDPSCETALCGRYRLFNSWCDLDYVANDRSISGNPTFLAEIAMRLNENDCFGDFTCAREEDYADIDSIAAPLSDIQWGECVFPVLMGEADALKSTISGS